MSQHLAQCRCIFGYTGDPYQACLPFEPPECVEDKDCPTDQVCINEKCINPCLTLSPCVAPATCKLVSITRAIYPHQRLWVLPLENSKSLFWRSSGHKAFLSCLHMNWNRTQNCQKKFSILRSERKYEIYIISHDFSTKCLRWKCSFLVFTQSTISSLILVQMTF